MRIGVDARNLVPNLSGIGRYVLEMVKALGEQGHQLVLYLPEPPYQPLPELRFCELRIANFKGPWRRVAWSMTALPHAANSDNLDVFWGPAHRLPAGLRAGLPRVVTIHDLVWRKAAHTMRWQTWLGERFFMASALKNAHAVVADSIATADDISEFRPGVWAKVKVIYPGLTRLPHKRGRLQTRTVGERKRPYALFVGTLEPRKNLPRLLQAFKLLQPSITERLNLVIAGGQGWRTDHLTSLIKENGLEGYVEMTGFVSDVELSQLYAGAEFLLMPSLYEGFGFPIIEAQSFGTPVITSNRSSMPEVAGKGALFVDPEDINQIILAMQKLHTDRPYRDVLGEIGKQNASRYTWKCAASELTALFIDAKQN